MTMIPVITALLARSWHVSPYVAVTTPTLAAVMFETAMSYEDATHIKSSFTTPVAAEDDEGETSTENTNTQDTIIVSTISPTASPIDTSTESPSASPSDSATKSIPPTETTPHNTASASPSPSPTIEDVEEVKTISPVTDAPITITTLSPTLNPITPSPTIGFTTNAPITDTPITTTLAPTTILSPITSSPTIGSTTNVPSESSTSILGSNQPIITTDAPVTFEPTTPSPINVAVTTNVPNIITSIEPSNFPNTNYPSSIPSTIPTSQQEVYESSFPLEPEQKRAATTYTVLSNRDVFNITSIRHTTHYLSGHLSGSIWIDVNGDGIRGSAINRSLNAMEYDIGIGNVNVSLVRCVDDTIVATTLSTPYSHGLLKEGISRRKTDDPIAGIYSFPINDGMGKEYIQAGRYYVMFQAPMGYKIGGNTLPLGRIRNNLEVEAAVVDNINIECNPGGGEGTNYIELAEEIGDLDWEGYCARTVGCVEVDTKFDLEDRFTNLQFMVGETNDMYEGTIRNLVALPTPIVLNIGMAVQPWPLDTDQFTDAEFTIKFPPGMSNDELGAIVPSEEEFSKSEIKTAMEETLASYFRNSAGAFKVGGFVLNDGIISPGKMKKETIPTAGGLLRRLRGLVENEDDEEEEEGATVTYSFTTRGRYNPPPYEPLGDIVSNSINADPYGIIKSLQNRKVGVQSGNNSNSPKPALASVFEQSTGAETRHLTLKKERSVQPIIVIQSSNSNLASWSKIPIALLSLSIASLIGVLLLRRVFGRLAVKSSVAFENGDNDPFELKKGLHNVGLPRRVFGRLALRKRLVEQDTISTASLSLNNVKKHKKKKKKKKRVAHSYAILDTSGEINTEEHKRVKSKKKKVNKRTSRDAPTEQCETQLIVAAEPMIENHVTQRQAQLAWEEQMQEQVMIMPVRPKRKTTKKNHHNEDQRIEEQGVIEPTRSNRNLIEPVAQSFNTHVTQRQAQRAWEEQIQEQVMIMPVRPKRKTAKKIHHNEDQIIQEQRVIAPTRSNRNLIEPVAQSYDTHVAQRQAQLAWEEQIREQGMIMPVRPKRQIARR